MNASLVIMAAGLGSRYGGSKQVDGVGPNGEILMEYSIYDALRAGFNKVVFIIKPEMEEMVRQLCGDTVARRTALDGARWKWPIAFRIFPPCRVLSHPGGADEALRYGSRPAVRGGCGA